MLTLITAHALRWIEHRRQRATLHRLLQMNDHMLDDIGLRRAEIEEALSHPLGTCPTPLTEARRLSRLSFALDRCV